MNRKKEEGNRGERREGEGRELNEDKMEEENRGKIR